MKKRLLIIPLVVVVLAGFAMYFAYPYIELQRLAARCVQTNAALDLAVSAPPGPGYYSNILVAQQRNEAAAREWAAARRRAGLEPVPAAIRHRRNLSAQ